MKTKSTHTPGPWKLDAHEEFYQAVLSIIDGEEKPVVLNVNTLANARLIAVAPELLEALKREHQHYHGHDYVNGHCKYACSVCDLIAKAEGK